MKQGDKNMRFDAIDGREMQVANFTITATKPFFDMPTDTYVEDTLEEFDRRLKQIFDGEFGNKIVRITHQRGNSSFLINAGFEKNLYTEVMDYVRKMLSKHPLPLTFQVNCFLTFSPLRDVNSDTPEE